MVAQWLRSHLATQETRVPSLIWEDATCLRATEHVRNHRARTREPWPHNY